jgi:succinate dehydrogenase / fumarate reductase, cytochrome b subunit
MQAVALYRSSIGKKALMAVTGLIWIGYVVMHMYGNLKAFQGGVYFNEYAEGLRSLGAPVFGHLHLLTIARVVLVAAIIVHIWAAWSLFVAAREARPTSYASRRVVQANYASLTMRYGGVVILLFVLFHLAHLTWGISPLHPDYIRGDAYHNLIIGFRSLPVVILYLIALVALALHLYHGTWSMFQTLGINDHNWDGTFRALAWLLAILIPVGFAVVPLAIQFGLILE